MVVTNEYQQTQNIEIYNVNTSQLVNVYHRLYGDEDFLVSNNSKPGIFAISTDSRLFAYSYGNNIITIYLMESGLEVVSKKFNNIHKIKFLEFIVKDRKLFIIEEDKENDVKFHIWLISGCLNDYFPISRDDLNLSDNDISTLLKYDGYYHILTKANGKIVTLKKDNEDQFRVLSDIFTKSVIFKENDSVIDEFKYDYSHDNLEPWNNSAGSIQSIRDGNYELGGGIDIINMINMGIFYYAGLYLLIAEFMQMKKYKTDILLGIIVFTLTIVKSFDETNRINGEGIVILTTVTTLILWIEMLFWLHLFSKIAIYIYIFGNILRKIIPFFAFMFILTIGVGHSMLIFFGYPSLLNLNPTASNFTLNNETGNFTFTGESPNNPFDTIWDAILSAYYWNAIYLSPYNYWPLKLFSSL
uniref:Ion transport domain-containing protein n=1 Tax=Rhizophagus irregularis (strain DAOM 181602 / DAOM 197198 / MUCL 43194) TaxID=747089 RepID=U9SI41_RHIID